MGATPLSLCLSPAVQSCAVSAVLRSHTALPVPACTTCCHHPVSGLLCTSRCSPQQLPCAAKSSPLPRPLAHACTCRDTAPPMSVVHSQRLGSVPQCGGSSSFAAGGGRFHAPDAVPRPAPAGCARPGGRRSCPHAGGPAAAHCAAPIAVRCAAPAAALSTGRLPARPGHGHCGQRAHEVAPVSPCICTGNELCG